MHRVAFVLAVALVTPACAPCTWRPALVISLTAIDGRRVSLVDGQVAERWDVRAAATFVLVPRTPRRLLRPERTRRETARHAAPCAATWLCVWERAARAEALARFSLTISETPP